ncbi:hypothetical protein [Amycolatopsis lexingtonensis]|uniref:hypothetical protein n=1 Tax=Amycolatopsis lexingtonensis TaxID=218822 RepID=UPI003F7148EB
MKDFWFEIVTAENGRYGWVFFSGRRGKQRELARSTRLYKSAGKARRAIGKLRGAPIGRPFTLPRTKFEFVPDVVPLTAREAPSRRRPIAAASPAARQAAPAARQGTPAAQQATPTDEQGTPAAEQAGTTDQQGTPTAQQATPKDEQPTPTAEQAGTTSPEPAEPKGKPRAPKADAQ